MPPLTSIQACKEAYQALSKEEKLMFLTVYACVKTHGTSVAHAVTRSIDIILELREIITPNKVEKEMD